MPALGGLTMRARWPLPSGLTRLISRWLRFFGVGLEIDQLVGVDRRQVAEDRAATGGVGVDAVDRVDPEHAPVLLGLARGAHGARDSVADAQAEAADLARADVHVLGARQQAVPTHEAEALVDDVEDAGGVGVAGALGLALEDLVDQVVLAVDRCVDLELPTDLSELGDAHLAQVADFEVVALARRLDLLLLLELRHGSAEGGLAASSRTAIAGTLVGAWAGHLVGVTWVRGGGDSGGAWRLAVRIAGSRAGVRAESLPQRGTGRDTRSIDPGR